MKTNLAKHTHTDIEFTFHIMKVLVSYRRSDLKKAQNHSSVDDLSSRTAIEVHASCLATSGASAASHGCTIARHTCSTELSRLSDYTCIQQLHPRHLRSMQIPQTSKRFGFLPPITKKNLVIREEKSSLSLLP